MKESAGSGKCIDWGAFFPLPSRNEGGRKVMIARRVKVAVLVLISLVFVGTVSAAELKLEMSEEAREEIQKMGDVAYLSVFELGSG